MEPEGSLPHSQEPATFRDNGKRIVKNLIVFHFLFFTATVLIVEKWNQSKHSVRTAQITQCDRWVTAVRGSDRYLLFEIHSEYTSTLCEQNAYCVLLNVVVHMLTTSLYTGW